MSALGLVVTPALGLHVAYKLRDLKRRRSAVVRNDEHFWNLVGAHLFWMREFQNLNGVGAGRRRSAAVNSDEMAALNRADTILDIIGAGLMALDQSHKAVLIQYREKRVAVGLLLPPSFGFQNRV